MNLKTSPIWAKSIFCLSLISTHGVAEPYAGLAYGYSNAEYLPSSTEAFSHGNPSLVVLQGGYFFNDYLAVEARYATSVQRASRLNVDSLASALVKANFPISSQVSIYAVSGYSAYSINKQAVGTVDDQGFSLGAGVHYAFDNHTALALDFVNYANGDEARLNSINLGFQYKF